MVFFLRIISPSCISLSFLLSVACVQLCHILSFQLHHHHNHHNHNHNYHHNYHHDLPVFVLWCFLYLFAHANTVFVFRAANSINGQLQRRIYTLVWIVSRNHQQRKFFAEWLNQQISKALRFISAIIRLNRGKYNEIVKRVGMSEVLCSPEY